MKGERMIQPPHQHASAEMPTSAESARPGIASLARESRGGVLLEYVVVLTFAGVLVALALLSLGPKTVRNYSEQRAKLYQSDP
jgi:hypothetical protein